MAAFDPLPIIRSIWNQAGLPLSRLPELVLTGSSLNPSLASSFKVAELAQITTALSALAASYLHELRTKEKLTVSVDKREAGLEFISEAWTLQDKEKPPPSIWDPLAGLYRTSDSFVRVHTNFPHHRNNLLNVLGLGPHSSRATVQEALLKVKSVPFETLATGSGCCVSALRSFEEWDASPQGQDAAERFEKEGCVVVERDGEGSETPEWMSSTGRRLAEGVKVLDMTRVIAGPVAGRTMAARGAQVLLLTSPNLPSLPTLDLDTSRGKRTAQLSLLSPSSLSILSTQILPSTSIFLQSYRPSSLSKKFPDHLSPSALRKIAPNVILASLSAYGGEGEGVWGGKRGFDSLVQTASGFNWAEGEAWRVWESERDVGEEGKEGEVEPRALPVQGLDHAAGQLLAFGMLAGLCRQFTEGGTYSISVSLISVAYLLRSLGRHSPLLPAAPSSATQPDSRSPSLSCFDPSLAIPKSTFPPDPEIARLQREYPETGSVEEGRGRRMLVAIRHAGRLMKEREGEGELGEAEGEGEGEEVLLGDGGAPMKLDGEMEVRWV